MDLFSRVSDCAEDPSVVDMAVFPLMRPGDVEMAVFVDVTSPP
jgi:hypothetical protein